MADYSKIYARFVLRTGEAARALVGALDVCGYADGIDMKLVRVQTAEAVAQNGSLGDDYLDLEVEIPFARYGCVRENVRMTTDEFGIDWACISPWGIDNPLSITMKVNTVESQKDFETFEELFQAWRLFDFSIVTPP